MYANDFSILVIPSHFHLEIFWSCMVLSKSQFAVVQLIDYFVFYQSNFIGLPIQVLPHLLATCIFKFSLSGLHCFNWPFHFILAIYAVDFANTPLVYKFTVTILYLLILHRDNFVSSSFCSTWWNSCSIYRFSNSMSDVVCLFLCSSFLRVNILGFGISASKYSNSVILTILLMRWSAVVSVHYCL